MKILAHRGWWTNPLEKNSKEAVIRALKSGFGIEIDVRDKSGKLYIAHDPTDGFGFSFEAFLDLVEDNQGSYLPLAINIKADGIISEIHAAIASRGFLNAFIFDMSGPETLHAKKLEANYFVRQSEFESGFDFYKNASGIWLDCFESEWYGMQIINEHVYAKKKVCIVSPELHRRDPATLWDFLKDHWVDELHSGNIYICTDFPSKAKDHFHG